jgi:hypothetical protein
MGSQVATWNALIHTRSRARDFPDVLARLFSLGFHPARTKKYAVIPAPTAITKYRTEVRGSFSE